MPTLVTRPYSGTGDASLPDSVKNLPAGAKKIWVAAFNSAWDNYDPGGDRHDDPAGQQPRRPGRRAKERRYDGTDEP